MRRIADHLMPFVDFPPVTPLVRAELPVGSILPGPEGLQPKDACFRDNPSLASQYIANVIHPVIQPRPQNGNRVGKRQ